MSHSHVLKLAAIVGALFGIALLLAPDALARAYKASDLSGPGLYNSMLYGACMIGVAVINWTSSRMEAAQVQGVILGNLVGNVLGLGAALYRQLADPAIPAAAWINVGIFLVFAVLFAQVELRMRAVDAPLARPPAA